MLLEDIVDVKSIDEVVRSIPHESAMFFDEKLESYIFVSNHWIFENDGIAPPDVEEKPLVVVVIPTYNEVENLTKLSHRIFALPIPNIRIIVVDDGSCDGTNEAATELVRKYHGRMEIIQRGRKLGLGTAYVRGFSRAVEMEADYVLQMDADFSHKPEDIPYLLAGLDNADIVVGSRYVAGGGVDEHWGFTRRILSMVGNLGIRVMAGLEVRDATSGFKAFRGEILGSIQLSYFKCKGFAFQAEMAHMCQLNGYNVVEYPIVFEERAEGKSKMSTGIIIEAIWRLLPLRWKRGY